MTIVFWILFAIAVLVFVLIKAHQPIDAKKIRSSYSAKDVIEIETSRPTVPRVLAGLVVGGPIGALVGFAWRKRKRQRVR